MGCQCAFDTWPALRQCILFYSFPPSSTTRHNCVGRDAGNHGNQSGIGAISNGRYGWSIYLRWEQHRRKRGVVGQAGGDGESNPGFGGVAGTGASPNGDNGGGDLGSGGGGYCNANSNTTINSNLLGGTGGNGGSYGGGGGGGAGGNGLNSSAIGSLAIAAASYTTAAEATTTIAGTAQLDLSGAFAQSSNSTLNLTVGSNSPLITADAATLVGTLNIAGNGFRLAWLASHLRRGTPTSTMAVASGSDAFTVAGVPIARDATVSPQRQPRPLLQRPIRFRRH